MHLKPLRGLPDIQPTTEVGFVLSAAIKGEKGNPTEGEGWHLLTPGTVVRKARTARGKEYNFDARDHHPRYRAYNNLPYEERRFFHCQLAFADPREFWEPKYWAQKGPIKHPDCEANPVHKGAWCQGGGGQAQRWRLTDPETGEPIGRDGKGDYVDIPCPGEACPFRQEFDTGRTYKGEAVKWTPCGRGMRIWFWPRWKSDDEEKWPRYLGKLKTYSRRAVNSFAGILHSVYHEPEDEADPGGLVQQLGIEEFTWIGLPFVAIFGKRRTERGVHTDITFAADDDIVSWLTSQRKWVEQLKAHPQQRLLGAASETEQSAEQQALDHETIVVTPTLIKPVAEVLDSDGPAEGSGDEQPEADPDPSDPILTDPQFRRLYKAVREDLRLPATITTAIKRAGLAGKLEDLDDGGRAALLDWVKSQGDIKAALEATTEEA